MKLKVEHLGLPAKNPTALKDWYLQTLGGKLIFENGQTPPAYFVELPGAILEIYEADFSLKETSENVLAGFRHLALQVDSIEAAKVELETKGVKFSQPIKPAGGGGRVLFFQDLDGNLLHLVERPKGALFNR